MYTGTELFAEPLSELESDETALEAMVEAGAGDDEDWELGIAEDEGNLLAEADYQVIGPDTRRRILSTKKVPFRYICKLEISRGGRNFVCTGTLVGPNKVLTAAHCLRQGSSRARRVRVIPGKRDSGRSRRSEPFGSAMSRRIHMPGRFRVAGDPFDYAVITLATPIGRRVGWWRRIAAWSDERVRRRKANTAGFPVDRHPRGDRMFWTYNSISSVRGPRMEYFHDTFGGQSGSPLWIRWRNNRTIIGVHSDRDDSATAVVANIGVHITPRILADIQRWIRL